MIESIGWSDSVAGCDRSAGGRVDVLDLGYDYAVWAAEGQVFAGSLLTTADFALRIRPWIGHLGNSVMAARVTLDHLVKVRILIPQLPSRLRP